ncbi:MAG: rRNA (uracil1939-C5)-methyltransferase [Clostridia bacterium]|nr:rRNA (uracil1939-C5)-methyltransferase [Clostridia bacterium]
MEFNNVTFISTFFIKVVLNMEVINITGLNHEGAGVGRLNNGKVVFVPGALVGEQVRIELLVDKKKYALGRLLEIEVASPDRVAPSCSEGSCGGCQLQHLSYNEQLKWKQQKVIDAFKRIGGFSDIEVLPVLGMTNPWRYRNKVRLHVSKGQLGFYQPGSHEVNPLANCSLLPSLMLEVARFINELLPNLSPGLKHVTLRQGLKTGEVLVFLEVEQGWTEGKRLAKELKNHFSSLVSVVAGFEDKKKSLVTLIGRDYLIEKLGNFTFHISPDTFFQVNTVHTEVLYNQVKEYAELEGEEEVLDAYCGSGSIAMWLSCKAKKVTGVEVVAQAIKDAGRNVVLNDIDNIEFHTGQAEVLLPRLAEKGYKPQVIVLDPPRAGCDRRVLKAVEKMKPIRVVYVSCNPATLARDVSYLSENGYVPAKVQPVDMFPYTHHVECVVSLKRIHSL